ncbi:MAG: peptide-methionine (S)-S-oxide reductase MsrA [Synechococcaceae cyanobacterium SM2_3_1]|nr:peptide-methionine (S)-S-oxide reductase MsrA [Synechococcaceae cyanobacterium SM2_3_1]
MKSKGLTVLILLFSLLCLSLGQPSSAEEIPLAEATFAGGCFWCMESDFEAIPGVLSVLSGYTGGTVANPTYHEVSSGRTGHAEAIRVQYDPDQISYRELLTYFWHSVDPLDAQGQFCDRGDQYRSAIFYHDEEQHRLAEQSKVELEDSDRFQQILTTEINPSTTFYPAEEYHQDYYLKNPLRYQFYRFSCSRDRRLTQLWGDKANIH